MAVSRGRLIGQNNTFKLGFFDIVHCIISLPLPSGNGRLLSFLVAYLKKQRVMVFIDGSNFYHSLKSNFESAKLDIGKFCGWAAAGGNLVKIFYYNAPLFQKEDPKAYKKQQVFFESLRKIKRLELFLGRLEKRPDNQKAEKGVDVKLAADLVTNAFYGKYDTAIIATNDADFVPAIKAVQERGKEVYNVSFPKSKSYHLNRVCDKTLTVTESVFKKLKWKK